VSFRVAAWAVEAAVQPWSIWPVFQHLQTATYLSPVSHYLDGRSILNVRLSQVPSEAQAAIGDRRWG
jgi:hypothetical protein